MSIDRDTHAEELGVCEVAGDLVQLGRESEARALLRQAPGRLWRECPVCRARPNRHCLDTSGYVSLRTPVVFNHSSDPRRSIDLLTSATPCVEVDYPGYARVALAAAKQTIRGLDAIFPVALGGHVVCTRFGIEKHPTGSGATWFEGDIDPIMVRAGVRCILMVHPGLVPVLMVPHLERVGSLLRYFVFSSGPGTDGYVVAAATLEIAESIIAPRYVSLEGRYSRVHHQWNERMAWESVLVDNQDRSAGPVGEVMLSTMKPGQVYRMFSLFPLLTR